MAAATETATSNAQMKKLVAEVRQVVRDNVRTDDIVLALYQCDMDVERTVQALTEGLCVRALT
jgi:hypothetical protein